LTIPELASCEIVWAKYDCTVGRNRHSILYPLSEGKDSSFHFTKVQSEEDFRKYFSNSETFLKSVRNLQLAVGKVQPSRIGNINNI
jgi:hypothetical protein